MRHIPRRLYLRLSGAHHGTKTQDPNAAIRRTRTLVYASAGGVVGALGGAFAGGAIGFLVGGALGYAFVYYIVHWVSEGGGAVMGRIYHPPGDSTPHAREYSEAKALTLRGLFQEAIDSYQTYVAEFPEDPEPCIAIARIYRDHLGRPDDAVQWFRRARQASGMDRGREILVTREIIEVYLTKLHQPDRALPELARLADRFAGTREGDLAKAELARLRQAQSEPRPS